MSTVEIGLISDTHGLLRPEALTALQGVARIIHAGDVGPQAILDELAGIAPVTVVRGNTDWGPEAEAWPMTAVAEVEGRSLYVIHDIGMLDLDAAAAGFAAVVYGHSHQPAAELRHGVLFVNPGAAGQRRFTLPITVARLRLDDDGLALRYHDLETGETGAWESFAVTARG